LGSGLRVTGLVDNTERSIVSLGSSSFVSVREGSLVVDPMHYSGRAKKNVSPNTQEGQMLLRQDILGLVSNMISTVGSKSNEHRLLRYVRISVVVVL